MIEEATIDVGFFLKYSTLQSMPALLKIHNFCVLVPVHGREQLGESATFIVNICFSCPFVIGRVVKRHINALYFPFIMYSFAFDSIVLCGKHSCV